MRAGRFCCLAALALALAACSLGRIGKPLPPPITYTIEASAQQTSPSSSLRRQHSLRVGRMRVAAAYSGTALLYRMNEVRVVSDPYNQLIAEPGPMLADQIAAWLERARLFQSVAHPDTSLPADYVLEGTVTELYGDFRPGQAPAAVLAIQLVLIDLTGTLPRSTYTQVIAQRVKLPAASPDALVRGYGQALTALLAQLTTDLETAGAR
jgi:cholesterol transport system auxiliary component